MLTDKTKSPSFNLYTYWWKLQEFQVSMESELLVALFDVLGFEDRIGRLSLDAIHSQYKELLSISASKGSHAFLDARPTGDGTMVPYFGFIEIEQDYFSDTILL